MCEPILVTLMKMRPHPAAHPRPLACYKAVPPREFKTLHVRESKTVLDSGFQTVDSRLEVQGPGVFVNDSGFLQLYSGFQSQIPDSISKNFQIPDSLIWGESGRFRQF